jgi:hypothetical protein
VCFTKDVPSFITKGINLVVRLRSVNIENEAPTTKSPEMAHSRCSPMHELITHLVQEGPEKNLVPNMASGIHRLHPISPRSPMLIEQHPSHLTKGTMFPLNHTILTSHIGRRKLMFMTVDGENPST